MKQNKNTILLYALFFNWSHLSFKISKTDKPQICTNRCDTTSNALFVQYSNISITILIFAAIHFETFLK